MKKVKLMATIICVVFAFLIYLIFSNMLTGSEDIQVEEPEAQTESYTEDENDSVLMSLPQNVQESYADYEANHWEFKSDKTEGTHDGSNFKNKEGVLRHEDDNGNQVHYREYDVNNKEQGRGRDAERFVTGSDGSVYYTNDHYESFVRIK